MTLRLVGIDRPEASATGNHGTGFLAVRIPLPNGALPECVPNNVCSTTGNYYTVELRQPGGWDQTATRPAVLIHKVMVTNGLSQTALKTRPVTEFLAGSTYQDGNIKVRVDSIDAGRSVATVTVTY